MQRRPKFLTIYPGALTDSLITHKVNGNLGRLHMNQLIIPYTNLTGAPIIPAEQVQTDWNATVGLGVLLNKPLIPTNTNQLVNGAGFITGITGSQVTSALGYTPYNSTNPNGYISSFTEVDPTVPSYSKSLSSFNVIRTSTDLLYYPLSSNPSGYITSVPAQSFSSLTGKPTTLSGYGITDAYPLTGNPSGFISSYTETDPLFNTKFAGKTTTDLAEGANLYFTTNRARAAFTAGIGIDITSGVISIPLSYNYVTRPVNSTTYTISATKNASVYYSIKIQCTASIGSNSAGTVALQYSTNGGSTWIDVGEVTNSNTVTLAIALNSVTVQTSVIAAQIPANALVRMNSTITGTTAITFVRGQEVY